MSSLFVDSSALAKRYLSETASAWLSEQIDPLSGNTVVVAEITRVEVAAALAARHRAQGITLSDRARLVNLLLAHCDGEYRIVAVTPTVTAHAVELTQMYRLRGYDAVQLASALAAVAALPDLRFVASDADLLAAALAEGLPCANPHDYA